ncbi:DUF5114 domain-containing protein [Bacteroides sp. OttesenSCG-928-J23]|nr:DUF5114 domain-containing protein [Bacteroides sp. OttesenSCG-928-J23]
MKQIKNIIALLAATILLAACNNDGDLIYLDGHTAPSLTATATSVELSKEVATQVVLSFVWNKSTLLISDDSMSATNVETIYLQASGRQDFSATVIESSEAGLSRAFTGAELNTLAKNLGLQPDVASPVYFRLRSNIGANLEAKYSEVAIVNIAPYEIDMSVAFIYNTADVQEIEHILLSPQSNGIYTGFMNVKSWYNFWLEEGDGTRWGNAPIDGAIFKVANAADGAWNCWFPDANGCYYVTFDTTIPEWSALHLPTVKVSGDLTTEMTFSIADDQWRATFDASAAGTINLRFNVDAMLYNVSTGDANSNAIPTPAAFAGSAESLTFGISATDIAVSVPAAGECTLIIDLADQNAWKVRVESGSVEEPEPAATTLYLPGIDDGISGSWTFDNFITLYNEDDLLYAGFANANSLWGYKMHLTADWGEFYTAADGDANAGTLALNGEGNIPAPAPGLTLVEADLKAMTYKHTAVPNRIWIMGMDEKYEFDTPLTTTETPGVYSGTITIAEDSPWGIEIQLDDSWSYKIGGSDGKLYYKGTAIKDDIVHVPGTYTVTVNLIDMSYIIE